MGQWVLGNYGEVIVASAQFMGLRLVVKMSKWLQKEIISKAAGDAIYPGLYDKAVETTTLPKSGF